MKQIIYGINTSQKPIFKALNNLMPYILTTSRLAYKPDLISMKLDSPLPTVPNSFSKKFEDVALARAQQIWQQNSTNLNLFWSGGIDSTVALISLLKTRPQNGRLSVFLNLNSINENTDFYFKLLSYDFVDIKNSSLLPFDSSLTIVTGELGDQIFGSDLLFKISEIFGYEKLFSPYAEVVPKLFKKFSGEYFAYALYERYEPIVKESPFQIKSTFDFIWWWNFSQKWQFVKHRAQGLIGEKIKAVHFFDSEDFQLWSLFNHHMKIGKSLEKYKLPAKEFIYNYDFNKPYFLNKNKVSSPYGNKIQFYILYDDGSKVYDWHESVNILDQLAKV